MIIIISINTSISTHFAQYSYWYTENTQQMSVACATTSNLLVCIIY